MNESVEEEAQDRQSEIGLLDFFRTLDRPIESKNFFVLRSEATGLLDTQSAKREPQQASNSTLKLDELPFSRERSRSKSRKSAYVIKHDQFHAMRELEPELLVESSKINKRLLRGCSLRNIEVELECLRWVKEKILKDGNF